MRDRICSIRLQILPKLFGEPLPERLVVTDAFIQHIVRILINDPVDPLVGVIHGSDSSRIHMVIQIIGSSVYKIRPLVGQVPDREGVGISIVIHLRVQILIVLRVFGPQTSSVIVIDPYLNDVPSVPDNILPCDALLQNQIKISFLRAGSLCLEGHNLLVLANKHRIGKAGLLFPAFIHHEGAGKINLIIQLRIKPERDVLPHKSRCKEILRVSSL